MQAHFIVDQRVDRGCAGTHLLKRFRLRDGQRPCTREVNKEDVVLHEAIQESLAWQRCIPHPFDEGMPSEILPSLACGFAPEGEG